MASVLSDSAARKLSRPPTDTCTQQIGSDVYMNMIEWRNDAADIAFVRGSSSSYVSLQVTPACATMASEYKRPG